MKRLTFKRDVVQLYQYRADANAYLPVETYRGCNRDTLANLRAALEYAEYQQIERKEVKVVEGFPCVTVYHDIFITGHKPAPYPKARHIPMDENPIPMDE